MQDGDFGPCLITLLSLSLKGRDRTGVETKEFGAIPVMRTDRADT